MTQDATLFASNGATYSQQQVTQETLRATQEELAAKIRELKIYEANYVQLKKELTRWKKKFEYIFRENELLSLEAAKLDAAHKQIAFLQQEMKFKDEEAEALRGLVSALEAANKKARASRMDSAARLAGRKDLPEAAASGVAVLENSVVGGQSEEEATQDEGGDMSKERMERAAEKERFLSEIAALKSENSLLLKDLDRRDAALRLNEEKVTAHKEHISTLESSLKDEQDKHMDQLREKQDIIVDLQEQLLSFSQNRRHSSAAREEAAFGTLHRLQHRTVPENGEQDDEDDDEEQPDTPPGTPPPISAGDLLPNDPKEEVVQNWTHDKKIRAAPSTEYDPERLAEFFKKIAYESREGVERVLTKSLDLTQYESLTEAELLVRCVSPEVQRDFQEFVVPLLKAHKHIQVTYSTMQRRVVVNDVRLTIEPRESEFIGDAVGTKHFGRDHEFYGPSPDDPSKLVLHTSRELTSEKKAVFVSKPRPVAAPGSTMSEDEEIPATPLDATAPSPSPNSDNGSTPAKKPKNAGRKWTPFAAKKLVGVVKSVARIGQAKYVHEGTTCQFCQMSPIVGARYSCATCVGVDMCEHCYSLGGHGLENSDELFYRVQDLALARCSRLTDELDLLEMLRFDICRSNLRKFSFCINWLADIINGKTSQQLEARALEIPGIRRDVRKKFVPLLARLCSDRQDLEVKTEWELESDNSAEVKSVLSSSAIRQSSVDGDSCFLETLRIWVADQYRTTSPFVERALLKYREGLAVDVDGEEGGDGDGDDDDDDGEDTENHNTTSGDEEGVVVSSGENDDHSAEL